MTGAEAASGTFSSVLRAQFDRSILNRELSDFSNLPNPHTADEPQVHPIVPCIFSRS